MNSLSTATKVIRQIAAGQVTGQSLRKKADQVVASSTCTTCRAETNGKPNTRKPDSPETPPKD